MAALLHFPAPAAAPPEPPGWRGALPLDAETREALLTACEATRELCAGNAAAARRLAQAAYNPVDLAARLDAIADALFRVGRRPPVNVWQQVIGPKS
jgi:hypothetical protein